MGEGSRRPSGMLMSVDLEPVQLVGPDGTPTAERRYHRD
ncbi:pyruvate dehydrogenase (acetyl-transferring) E1 component subunit alpha, partial [Staphylococcus aureus]